MKIFLSSLGLSMLLLLTLAQCGGDNKTATNAPAFDQQLYLEKGKSIAQATFTELSAKLAAAIGEKGIAGAIEYCNIAAMPLVDSLSKAHNASIRRTSFRVRNPENAPNEWERGILAGYEDQHKKGQELKPVAKELDANTVAFAAPILTQPLCLKCHGEIGKDIALPDYQTIKKLYPGDEAFGFVDRELRGMWSITFKK